MGLLLEWDGDEDEDDGLRTSREGEVLFLAGKAEGSRVGEDWRPKSSVRPNILPGMTRARTTEIISSVYAAVNPSRRRRQRCLGWLVKDARQAWVGISVWGAGWWLSVIDSDDR
jgi:hypothetical protein